MTKQPRLIKARPSYTAEFQRFWRTYPLRRPNPKALAAEAWHAALRSGEDAEALIQAAGRFAEEVRREKLEPAFIPHARTWLQQRRFDDYGDPEVDEAGEAGAADPGPALDPLKTKLRGALPPHEFTFWVEPLELARVPGSEPGEDALTVTAPTRMLLERAKNHYAALFRRLFGVREVEFELAPKGEGS